MSVIEQRKGPGTESKFDLVVGIYTNMEGTYD